MYSESLQLFLDLLKRVDSSSIKNELFTVKPEDSKTHVLSFNKIYIEIREILIKSSNRPDATDSIWFKTLRSLFTIKENLTDGSGTKSSVIRGMIYSRITEMMSLMSDYVDFNKIVETLLEIDPNTTYEHCIKWFEGLYSSKNDQELLYTSAKRLLSNENSSLIDMIIERNNVGFIGDRDKQIGAICDLELGGFVNDGAFILTTCEHKFHSKGFFEEIKNRRINEGKKESDIKPECPMCKKHHVEFEDKKRKQSKPTGKKRRGTKRKNKKQESSKSQNEIINNESDDDMNAHPLMDKKVPIRTMEMYEREYRAMNSNVYKQKLSAFDEDFASSQLNFTLD